jgi:hypothetical protein
MGALAAGKTVSAALRRRAVTEPAARSRFREKPPRHPITVLEPPGKMKQVHIEPFPQIEVLTASDPKIFLG